MDFQEGRCSDVDCWCFIPAACVKFVITWLCSKSHYI